MTTPEFQARYPKPWRFVKYSQTFSLRAANGALIGSLQLGTAQGHAGVPQKEWNRHVAAGLSEYITCTDQPVSPSAILARAERAVAP